MAANLLSLGTMQHLMKVLLLLVLSLTISIHVHVHATNAGCRAFGSAIARPVRLSHQAGQTVSLPVASIALPCWTTRLPLRDWPLRVM